MLQHGWQNRSWFRCKIFIELLWMISSRRRLFMLHNPLFKWVEVWQSLLFLVSTRVQHPAAATCIANGNVISNAKAAALSSSPCQIFVGMITKGPEIDQGTGAAWVAGGLVRWSDTHGPNLFLLLTENKPVFGELKIKQWFINQNISVLLNSRYHFRVIF